ncbi:MAG: DUF1553 domain-containing protein [Planctomycetota bacterium]
MVLPRSLAFLVLPICLAQGLSQNRQAFGADFDFNRDIRPILSENCFYCHGQDSKKREAGLRIDTRAEAVESGAIVPGDVSASELIQRIVSEDPDTLMPPPRSNRRLTSEQKQKLQAWIEAGAPYANHWAFDPPRSAVPPNAGATWTVSPLDAYIAAGHEQQGLLPQKPAPRQTLIKSLYVDLIGVPPEPEEVTRFVESEDPLAYERLVDSLLADPGYGQRMALPWLDAARYADSNGFQQDGDTWQWLWRDWVVRAMNENLPFDEFTIWQLAGDLLPDATIDQKIASGFNRNHLLNGEGGAIAEEQRFVILFDRIDTTCTTWLGLTMACAQCHDHKYDPMTMRDYYSLMDAFNRVPESGVPQYFSSRVRVAPPLIELPTPENQRRIAEYEQRIEKLRQESQPLVDAAYLGWRLGTGGNISGLAEPISAILQKRDEERNDDEKNQLEKGLREHFDGKVLSGLNAKLPILGQLQAVRNELAAYRNDQIPRPMIMSDAQPRETRMLDRGEYLKPLDPVTFTTPAFLPPMAEGAPRNRLGLAQWLVSPEHPLTTRVQVNRMWQHFFGMGIVKTAEDFGVQSEYPVHGPLLDFLAVRYRESGWNTKRMHRDVITSATYMQSSRVTDEGRSKDPENRWFARAGRFRMSALLLRDWALSAASLIDRRVGGAPVYPYQPDDIWESLAITKERDFTYPASRGADLYRRSVYTFWRRTVGPANMFDTSNRQACRVRQSQTSTPLHALTTLNDPTWVEAARELAQRCLEDSQDPEHQLRSAFARVVARPPNGDELNVLMRAYQKHRTMYDADLDAANRLLGVGAKARNPKLDTVSHAAMTNVCLTMLNLDEALTRE